MQLTGDIRKIKNELRQKYREYRSSLSAQEKDAIDNAIFRRVISGPQYKKSPLILLYMSGAIEVDTLRLVEHSLNHGKRVALPRCIPNTRSMEFFIIKSLDDVEKGSFGVLEPIPQKCEKLQMFDGSLCIVPGLGFDMNGFRLGFGKGYYDRFLSEFSGETMGICYSACVTQSLPHGRFDKRVNYLVTENLQKHTAY